MRRYHKKLGEILIEEKAINAYQLDLALKHQKRWGGKLASILLELGSIMEELLVPFLEKQVGWKWIALNDIQIDPHVLKIVKADIAHKFQIIPLDFMDGKLTIVTSYPSDYDTLRELRFLLALKEINTVFAVEPGIAHGLEKLYPRKNTEKFIFRNVRGGMEMVKYICTPFPFYMERISICTRCNTANCGNLTLWLRKGLNSPKRFILKDPSDVKPYMGTNKRSSQGIAHYYKRPLGRIEDLIKFTKTAEIVDINDLRKEAFRYISGVDSCHGFHRERRLNDDRSSQRLHEPHSLQNKTSVKRLFNEAMKDTRILRSPGEKIKSRYGKKSYMNGI